MTSEMVWPLVAAGGVLGCALGVLAALLWRAKREQALRVEVELLRVRVKTEESVGGEREQALDSGARATAGRVRRSGPRQPAEQQRGVPATGARATDAPAAWTRRPR